MHIAGNQNNNYYIATDLQIDTTMKTRTKIIWICLGYLVFTLGLIYRIVRFINGQASTLDLVTAIAMSFSCIYLLALNHRKLLKEYGFQQTTTC